MKTRRNFLLAGCAIFSLLPGQLSAQSKQDTLSVTNIVNGVTTYSTNNRMDLFAALWDDNATFITIAGLVAKGKDKIVDMHALGKYIIDSSTAMTLEPPAINFISDKVAIAYSVWRGLVFNIKNQKGPVQSGYLTCVLLKEKDGWKIVSATNATNGSFAPHLSFTEYSHAMWKGLLGEGENK